MKAKVCVFQDWMFELSMQQQSVLVLACRGPDGVEKFHPIKPITAFYRATVMKAAYVGRPLLIGEAASDNTFMTLAYFNRDQYWEQTLQTFFEHVDGIPHHYYMHLMHGAQIVGYKHPDEHFSGRWNNFYQRCCNDLHLGVETKEQMDHRLGDWGRRHWDNLELASCHALWSKELQK